MTEGRQVVSLGSPPKDPHELQTFPRRALTPEQGLWRVVRKGRGPWWFASTGGGRFDLREPEGTCYLATDELSALLETIGPERTDGGISTRFFDDRRIRHLHAPRMRALADLTSRRCAGFGITLEIHTVVPYDLPRAWALSLRRAGLQGLLYFVRHDPAVGKGIALFGRQGERKAWRRGRELPVAPALIARLRDECGLKVIEVPRRSELRIVDPPARR